MVTPIGFGALPLPDDGILASGSDDGTVRLWNVPDGQCINVLDDHPTIFWRSLRRRG